MWIIISHYKEIKGYVLNTDEALDRGNDSYWKDNRALKPPLQWRHNNWILYEAWSACSLVVIYESASVWHIAAPINSLSLSLQKVKVLFIYRSQEESSSERQYTHYSRSFLETVSLKVEPSHRLLAKDVLSTQSRWWLRKGVLNTFSAVLLHRGHRGASFPPTPEQPCTSARNITISRNRLACRK